MDSSSASASSFENCMPRSVPAATESSFEVLRICKWCKKEYPTKRKLKSHKLKRHPDLLVNETQRKVQKVLTGISKSRNQKRSGADNNTNSDSNSNPAITDNKQDGLEQVKKKSNVSQQVVIQTSAETILLKRNVKPTASIRPLKSKRSHDHVSEDEANKKYLEKPQTDTKKVKYLPSQTSVNNSNHQNKEESDEGSFSIRSPDRVASAVPLEFRIAGSSRTANSRPSSSKLMAKPTSVGDQNHVRKPEASDQSPDINLGFRDNSTIADLVKTRRDAATAQNCKIIKVTKARIENHIKSSVPVIKLKRAIISSAEEDDTDYAPQGKVSKTKSETVSKLTAPGRLYNEIREEHLKQEIEQPKNLNQCNSSSEDDESFEEKETNSSNTGQNSNLSTNGTKKCPVCNEPLPYTSNPNKARYREHVDIHRGLRPFVCPHYKECRRSFTNPIDLLAHTGFAHNEEDVFECDRCGQTFNFRRYFNYHMRKCNGICTGEKTSHKLPKQLESSKSNEPIPEAIDPGPNVGGMREDDDISSRLKSASAHFAKSMKDQLATSRTGSDKLSTMTTRQRSRTSRTLYKPGKYVELSRGNKTYSLPPPTDDQREKNDSDDSFTIDSDHSDMTFRPPGDCGDSDSD